VQGVQPPAVFGCPLQGAIKDEPATLGAGRKSGSERCGERGAGSVRKDETAEAV